MGFMTTRARTARRRHTGPRRPDPLRDTPRPFALATLAVALSLVSCSALGSSHASSRVMTSGASTPARTTSSGASASPTSPRPLPPAPWRGITVDSTEDLDQTVAAIAALAETPTVRLVLDPDTSPEDYDEAVARIAPHAHLMGQVLDSTAMAETSAAEAAARAERFVSHFGSRIALWEVGNELNGEWVGRSPAEINAKVAAMHAAVRRHGGRSAITLNYWSGPQCYSKPWEATVPFALGMPSSLDDVDVVMLSVYETVCDPIQRPDASALAATLGRLGKRFPRAMLGIGEVGAQGVEDGLPRDPTLAERQRIAQRYYGMHAALKAAVGPRYVGGYFWWYFRQDAATGPRDRSLWGTLNTLLSGLS